MASCISIRSLNFGYDDSRCRRRLEPLSLEGDARRIALVVDHLDINKGELVIFCGANGAGKSTLLSILGGRRMVPPGTARILGRDCFDDCTLTSKVCYVGERWSERFLDVTISEFLGENVVGGERCSEMSRILGINLGWRLSQLSDGQRRRCQILSMFTSSSEYEVYILDESTADLDIISRERLLAWLRTQAKLNGVTILYATHILEGLNEWASRMIFLDGGRILRDIPVTESLDLYNMCKTWLMKDFEQSMIGTR